eukprot:TRINITY_DN3785_c0_g1_i1.p1 TRINITY_DN3785_c0_g1~~TRINITY_DN3785_c0_g1_i1.p1  ORF type:complete len:143 (-),score=23.26 TRINITY_DN3785_c0_g1_i1:207-635(-)
MAKKVNKTTAKVSNVVKNITGLDDDWCSYLAEEIISNKDSLKSKDDLFSVVGDHIEESPEKTSDSIFDELVKIGFIKVSPHLKSCLIDENSSKFDLPPILKPGDRYDFLLTVYSLHPNKANLIRKTKTKLQRRNISLYLIPS